MLNNTLFFFALLSSIGIKAQLRVHPIGGGLFLFQNIENKTKENAESQNACILFKH